MTAIVGSAPPTVLQFFDNRGNPAAGGSVLTQVGGVNYATYQDAAGATPLPNPIPLNSRGEISNSSGVSCQLFLVDGVTYTFTLYDAAGNQLNQAASVAADNTPAQLAGSSGSSLVGFIQSGTGATAMTVQQDLRLAVNVIQYGAKGDGTTDDTTAVTNALAALGSSGGVLDFPRTANGYLVATFTVPNNNCTIRLNGNIIYSDAITLSGSYIIFDLGGGTVNGRLKHTTIAPGGGGAIGGTSITVVDGTQFAIGDGIQSSYGLGSDGSRPITITNIVGNVISFAALTGGTNSQTAVLPDGSDVGNWGWNATIACYGQNLIVRNGTINESKGYAIGFYGGSATVDHIGVTNNGLDQLYSVSLGGVLQFFECYFGNILDTSKQGFSIKNASNGSIELYACKFARNNSDPDFFVFGTCAGLNILTRDCTFIGTNTHAAPYNLGAFTSIDLNLDSGQTIGSIKNFNGTYVGYSQSIIQTPSGNTTPMTISDMEYVDCTIDNGMYTLVDVTVGKFWVKHCTFTSQATGQNHGVTASTAWVTYDACKFVSDQTVKAFVYADLKDCDFSNCTAAQIGGAAQMSGGSLVDTQAVAYPYYGWAALRLNNVKIQLSTYATDTYLDNAISLIHGKQVNVGGPVWLKNGTLQVVPYSINSANTPWGVRGHYQGTTTPLWGLWGDDWRIPLSSVFQDVTGATFKTVNKSNVTTTTKTEIAGATTITVTTVTGIAASDFITLQLVSGRVHMTTVNGAPAGSVVTLTDAIPAGESVASGAHLTAFTWA